LILFAQKWHNKVTENDFIPAIPLVFQYPYIDIIGRF